MSNWLSPLSGAAAARIWMNPRAKQELQPPARLRVAAPGGFVLWAHQLEASSEATEQRPHNPVLTITASTGWSENKTWWHMSTRHRAWPKLTPGWALPSAPHARSVTWLVAALLPSPFQAQKLKKVLAP